MAEWNASGRLVTPPEVAELLLDGCHVLEAFRRYRGLTATQLADRSGIDLVEVGRLERGEIEASSAAGAALAQVLNIDPAWLGVCPRT